MYNVKFINNRGKRIVDGLKMNGQNLQSCRRHQLNGDRNYVSKVALSNCRFGRISISLYTQQYLYGGIL
jgi:hypothetical protein